MAFTGKTSQSIHPRRPRLADLGIRIPKDSDGAFRAEGRLDGKIFNLGRHSAKNKGDSDEESPSNSE